MSVARELSKLQEVDQKLASDEQAQARVLRELQGNREIAEAGEQLGTSKEKLDDLTHRQRSLEREIEDISSKLLKFETELYSGKTANAKELSGIQKEIENLKANKGKLEDQDLELMEEIEQAGAAMSGAEAHLRQLETTWTTRKEQLAQELQKLESAISGSKERRQTMAATFETDILHMYEELKKKRGTSVAKVDKGICQGCRIQLPVNEQQQVRSGSIVRCSSCGRILFTD